LKHARACLFLRAGGLVGSICTLNFTLASSLASPPPPSISHLQHTAPLRLSPVPRRRRRRCLAVVALPSSPRRRRLAVVASPSSPRRRRLPSLPRLAVIASPLSRRDPPRRPLSLPPCLGRRWPPPHLSRLLLPLLHRPSPVAAGRHPPAAPHLLRRDVTALPPVAPQLLRRGNGRSEGARATRQGGRRRTMTGARNRTRGEEEEGNDDDVAVDGCDSGDK
jgi:hypothetical protein